MLALGLAAMIQTSQSDWPLTRAERTNYTETSHYEDVVAFLDALKAKGAPIRVEWMGESAEGKKMPLVVASRPPLTLEEARRSGRPIFYIEANIHAGEVEGKEAALALLRDWSRSKSSPLDRAVVLMAPIYNIDGNEQFGPVERNRPEQDGPALVGVRPNGQGFDLNRDCIKAESPEMRGVLKYVWQDWNPDVVIDLHTTDGTRHGYDLTYSPPLNPNTNPDVMRYARDVLLPDVRAQIRKEHGIELFDYGNVESRGGERSYRTFEPLGRYVTNYAGLRNRVGLLSEAATYIPFKDRVLDTARFVQACVDHVLKNASRVVEMTRRADKWRPKDLGVRFEFASRGNEDVLLEKLGPGEKRPLSGRPKELEKIKMPIFDRFKATKSASVPAAYVIPSNETAIVDLLRRHGIVVERMKGGWSGEGDVFVVTKVDVAAQAYQGHKAVRLEGDFRRLQSAFSPGAYLVRTDQPLCGLAFAILEPESTDGAVAWGFLAQAPTVGGLYPIVKCRAVPKGATERVQ